MSTHPLIAMLTRDASLWYLRHRARLRTAPPAAVAAAGAAVLAVAAALLFLVWQILATLATAVAGAVRLAADGQLARTITDPVGQYLTAHAQGLPATAEQLRLTWAGATVLLFLVAATGSRGGRIGWTVMGALTVAMVYAGSPATARTVAAGLAVTAWALASVPAFALTRRRPMEPVILTPAPPARPARTGTAAAAATRP